MKCEIEQSNLVPYYKVKNSRTVDNMIYFLYTYKKETFKINLVSSSTNAALKGHCGVS